MEHATLARRGHPSVELKERIHSDSDFWRIYMLFIVALSRQPWERLFSYALDFSLYVCFSTVTNAALTHPSRNSLS